MYSYSATVGSLSSYQGAILNFQALKELPIDGADPYTIIINKLVSSIGVDFLHNIRSIPF